MSMARLDIEAHIIIDEATLEAAEDKLLEMCDLPGVECLSWRQHEGEKTAQLIRETDRERHWHCSRCGKVFGLVGLMHKYCPECGARLMGGGRDAD